MEAKKALNLTPTKELDERILMMMNQAMYKQKLISLSVYKKVEAKILRRKD